MFDLQDAPCFPRFFFGGFFMDVFLPSFWFEIFIWGLFRLACILGLWDLLGCIWVCWAHYVSTQYCVSGWVRSKSGTGKCSSLH